MQQEIKQRLVESEAALPEAMHPVLRRIYAGRNVSSADELDYSLDRLIPYTELGNVETAAALLAQAMAKKKRLLIVADYDVDGATACALGIRALKAMGAADIDYLVPDRFVHGYGLSPDVVELAMQRAPDLLITVDNGISSITGVELARRNGIDVLITDHHLPGAELPAATVIVNPNLPGERFPGKNLAGVGVMFYLLIALRAHLRQQDWFTQAPRPEPHLAGFLDLVALGTVADLVPLDHNNRILVAQGLERIRRGRCVAGIAALLRRAGRTPENISASDLGFAVGPRLNAAGRLRDMRLGIECLLCDEAAQAEDIAKQLDGLNRERQRIQAAMQIDAGSVIAQMDLDEQASALGLCLYKQEWHQGVIGILASRIKDELQRPVIIFARDDGGVLKGSGRSIKGVHLKDVIDHIATQAPDLILKYGGHAMAAGLSICERDYEKFSALFDQEIRRLFRLQRFDTALITDGDLAAEHISLPVAQLLSRAGPWGPGFPEPLFEGRFDLLTRRIVGEKHLKLVLSLEDEKVTYHGIAFNMTDAAWEDEPSSLQLVYQLDINRYQGDESVQLIIRHLRPIYAVP